MAAKAAKKADVAELPPQPQVGDRPPEARTGQRNDGRRKVSRVDFDPDAIRVVTREDPWNPGGGRRLWFEGIPHCFSSRDVNLAWNTDAERREMLRAKGWHV